MPHLPIYATITVLSFSVPKLVTESLSYTANLGELLWNLQMIDEAGLMFNSTLSFFLSSSGRASEIPSNS
jgi:hypothetical protein